MQDALLLHCLRHVGEAAANIKHNNDAAKAGGETLEMLRDQGFTRPKVLPVRSGCLHMGLCRGHMPGSITAAHQQHECC